MQVLQSLENLSDDHFAFRFRTFEPLNQQWAVNVLHQNEDVKIICKSFVCFDNVGMVNLLQYLQLSKHLIFHAILINDGLEYFFKSIQYSRFYISYHYKKKYLHCTTYPNFPQPRLLPVWKSFMLIEC